MGTDRTSEYRGPCPCGRGRVEIDQCSPDHAWPSASVWWEGSLQCEHCAAEYDLWPEVPGERLKWVRNADLNEKGRLERAWQAADTALMESPGVRDLIARFLQRLDQEPSVAAQYRLFKQHDLVTGTEGTFRKHLKWSGVPGLVRSLRPSRLPGVLAALGEPTERFDAELRELDDLWERWHRRLPPQPTGIHELEERLLQH